MTNTKPINPPTNKKLGWIRLNQRFAHEFEKAGYTDLAQKLHDCETTNALVCCSNCGKHWYVLNRCRQRVCVLCSFRVAQERKEYLSMMTKDMQHPKLITLTQRAWKSPPKDGIKRIRTAFNKLRRTKLFKAVRGGAYIIEVIPKPGYWHIHMHILLDSPYLAYQRLFSEWKKILGEKAPQVDIRSASDKRAREYLAKDASKNIVYYVKPEMVVAWYEATKGLRLFATFGTWYHVKIAEQLELSAWEKVKPVCPFCGAEHTTFFARDGPWIIGWELWKQVWEPVLADVPELIPLDVDGVTHIKEDYSWIDKIA